LLKSKRLKAGSTKGGSNGLEWLLFTPMTHCSNGYASPSCKKTIAISGQVAKNSVAKSGPPDCPDPEETACLPGTEKPDWPPVA